MNLKNKSERVFCIGETRILPNQTAAVDDSYKKNAVITAMMKSGELEEIEENAKAEVKERASMEDFDALLETNPNFKQIQAFARKNGINTSDAKSVEELTAVIKAVLLV